jgi:hypothetical protein
LAFQSAKIGKRKEKDHRVDRKRPAQQRMSKRKREEADGLIDEVDEEDFKLTEAEIAELIDTAPEVRSLFIKLN